MLKMKTIKFLLSTLLIASIAVFTSCGDDDSGPAVLTIVSVEASGTDVESGEAVSGIDLNGATSAQNVPVDLSVVITFDRDVDASTASSTTITLSDGTNTIPVTVTVNGAVVTLTISDDLIRGTDYTVTLAGTIAASDGGTLSGAVDRSFTTGGRLPVVPPNAADQNAYWNFDANATDQEGNYVTSAEIAVTYDEDRFGQAESAIVFDGDETIVEIADADAMMSSNDFTLSFWMKTNSIDHVNENGDPAGQFVFGLAAFYGFRVEIPGGYNNLSLANRWLIDNGVDEPYTRNEGFSVNGDGVYNETGGWKGHTFEADLSGSGGIEALLKDRWVHIVFTYDAASKVGDIYIDGQLMKSQDYNLYGETHPQFNAVGWAYGGEVPTTYPELAFGFIQSRAGELWDSEPWGSYDLPTSNHYKGMLDDFRVFQAPFSGTQVADLYNAEKP